MRRARGTNRGGRGGVPSFALTNDPVRALRKRATIGSVFRPGEYYVIDDFTGLYLGAVDDLDPTHVLRQTDVTRQPAAPVAESLVLNRNVVQFRGYEWLDSNRAASAWKSLHDGTGREICAGIIHRGISTNGARNCLWSTINYLGASQIGVQFTIIDQNGATNERTDAWVLGASISNATTALAANLDKDVPTRVGFGYRENDSPEWRKYERSALASSGNSGVAPSAANPSFTLRVGSHHASAGIEAFQAYADIVFMVISRPGQVFSATDRSIINAWALERYGIT